MKKSVFSVRSILLAMALAPVLSVCAQDEEEAAAEEGSVVKEALTFYNLPKCALLKGVAEVQKPLSEKWEPMELGRYYPLGAIFRTAKGSKVCLEVGVGVYATICEDSELQFRYEKIGIHIRTAILRRGRVEFAMPRTMKDGEFSVSAPHFQCKNMGGDSWFEHKATGDGDEAVVHVTSGRMSIDGRHYSIAAMDAADRIRIRTTGDDLFTSITGEQGGFLVKIDQGIIRETDPITKEHTDKPAFLHYDLTPKCEVKFWRSRTSLSGKMIVSTMVFDAQGSIKSRRAFAEDRYNVNSGELVIKPKGEATSDDKKRDESEETETEEADLPAEESAGDNASNDDDSSSGDALEF